CARAGVGFFDFW
nr:immunoglobulin heavy chain junction region [Macaca mulatta]